MAKSIVGLDIASESIRAVEIRPDRKNRPMVLRAWEVPLPEGAVKSGEVVEVHTVAAALKQLWSAASFSSKRVVLGMGNPKVLVRDLTVPKLSHKDIRRALPFQVQDMLPVPVVDALLDFYPVKETASDQGPMVSGLLVAAVKDSVMANVRAVQLAGLTPVDVDLIPFALNRVHQRTLGSESTVALIDIGAKTTNVIVVKDGVPQFVRIIPVGGADVTKALVARLGITAEQAEVGKRQLGLVRVGIAPQHLEAAEIVREVTQELLNSLRNTLSFYVNSHQGERIERIVLSGGGTTMRNFTESLFELTRIPVTISDPFGDVPMKASALKSAPEGGFPNMTVALGLALRGAA